MTSDDERARGRACTRARERAAHNQSSLFIHHACAAAPLHEPIKLCGCLDSPVHAKSQMASAGGQLDTDALQVSITPMALRWSLYRRPACCRLGQVHQSKNSINSSGAPRISAATLRASPPLSQIQAVAKSSESSQPVEATEQHIGRGQVAVQDAAAVALRGDARRHACGGKSSPPGISRHAAAAGGQQTAVQLRSERAGQPAQNFGHTS